MITTGLRDLFTVHGCEVIATGNLDLTPLATAPPDVLVIDAADKGPDAVRQLRKENPEMALIIIDDAHMTVYPAGSSGTPCRSPLTEERLLRAAAAL